MKVYKLNGQIINIGDWDTQPDPAGLATNPRPEGAVEAEAEMEFVAGRWVERGFAVVPRSVTPLQMRKALRATGLKATVDAALSSSPEAVREEWEYATEILRDNATLAALAAALGKSDADLDALFQVAATF